MKFFRAIEIIISLGIVGLVVVFFSLKNSPPKVLGENTTLDTPTDTTVSNVLGKSDVDLCKSLQAEDTKDVDQESLNIQSNIGYQNNKFGLYIYRVDDFAIKAAEMVNSNGGDWGYVLVPYNVTEYDSKKWDSFFAILKEYHLIPVIQLWDISKDPQDMLRDTKKSAQFLNSLNWPIKNRYISVYNEVNDERFWKSGINPEEYAWVLDKTIDIYKNENSDFFILNGAFNASAFTGPGYLSEDTFLLRMDNSVPGIFSKLDGWASHPYPHINGYLGTPEDTGRNSIRAYEWELEILERSYGVKDLPVFITETGWPHAEGKNINLNYEKESTVSQYIKRSFENVWLTDNRVVAVTPFTIKYDPPFDHFSWIKSNGDTYQMFDTIKGMSKIAGKPPVTEPYNPLKEKCSKLKENTNN
ncbi:hypothetical protein GW755_03745 [bacterium]|nr:hypothetical protein [bacterium]